MTFDFADLNEAITTNDLNMVKKIISQCPQYINEPLNVFGPPLCIASRKGHLEIVKFLIKSGADMNLEGGISKTNPVEHAASKGHADTLRYLLSIGAHMETKTGQQNPLLSAIYNGHTECAKILIDHGIDFNTTYERPGGSLFNALSHSVDYDRTEIADYLRNKGAILVEPAPPPDLDTLPDSVFQWFTQNIGKPSNLRLTHILPTESGIEICKIKPGKSRPFLTLFTLGLSRIPLSDPSNPQNQSHSEIFIQLPPDWKTDKLDDPVYSWPFQWLNRLANNAAMEQTGLGWPITVISREKHQIPLAPNTRMDSILLMPMHEVESDDKPDIHLYQMVPLYPEERILEKQKGAKALMDALTKIQAPLIVDVNRKNGAEQTNTIWEILSNFLGKRKP